MACRHGASLRVVDEKVSHELERGGGREKERGGREADKERRRE